MNERDVERILDEVMHSVLSDKEEEADRNLSPDKLKCTKDCDKNCFECSVLKNTSEHYSAIPPEFMKKVYALRNQTQELSKEYDELLIKTVKLPEFTPLSYAGAQLMCFSDMLKEVRTYMNTIADIHSMEKEVHKQSEKQGISFDEMCARIVVSNMREMFK